MDDDALQALWTVFDQTGIRPEYLLPVLYFESGFAPSATNAGGYYGVAQTSARRLAALGVTPAAFSAMTAGDQIRTAVLPYFAGVVKSYGPIKSATRAEQANFEPATLPYIRSLQQILEPRGTRAYADNAAAFDPAPARGAITLASLAGAMTRAAAAPATKAAIARAYVLRPTEAPAHPPVYGDDFVDPGWTLAAVAIALVAATR